MSPGASLTESERRELLEEVRTYLPAFLHRGASEQQDPVGDVLELFDLEPDDLARVVAVHRCLDDGVLALGERLEAGLQEPFACSARVPSIRQSVRGQIDWPRTVRHRAQAPGEVVSFAVRESGSAFGTAENRAVAWLLGELAASVDAAITWTAGAAEPNQAAVSWSQKLDRLRRQLDVASRVPWLRSLRGERPTPQVLQSIRASRSRFYSERVPAAIDCVLRTQSADPEVLTEVLAQRYFRPDDDGTLFEVAVALRLARAFAASSPYPRRTRLLIGEGKSTFARYRFDDDVEVRLAYQTWPDSEHSMRFRLNQRHQLKYPQEGRPDIVITRSGEGPDAIVLELKATHRAATVRKGLAELLAYLYDRPDLWGGSPAGWLVVPPSEVFEHAEIDPGFPLWIVAADRVSTAATARFVGDRPRSPTHPAG